ncbi:MAG: thiamine phosphate synthase [Abditibacteriota bacterium]|nr:thiamine phosphate synthase [Abditibacteriota bacterium]
MYSDLIAVTNRRLVSGDFLTQLKKIADLKPEALFLREKDLSDGEYLALARKVREIFPDMFVCGRIGVAREMGCRRIHLPFGDFLTADLSGFDEVSVSCHSLEEAKSSSGADMIVLGTIFETDCKKGLKGKGLDFLREVCAAVSVPVYAIGGITPHRLPEIKKAGAAGGCMMSYFMRI